MIYQIFNFFFYEKKLKENKYIYLQLYGYYYWDIIFVFINKKINKKKQNILINNIKLAFPFINSMKY